MGRLRNSGPQKKQTVLTLAAMVTFAIPIQRGFLWLCCFHTDRKDSDKPARGYLWPQEDHIFLEGLQKPLQTCTARYATRGNFRGHVLLLSHFLPFFWERKISPKFFRPKFFRGHPRGMSVPKCVFFKNLLMPLFLMGCFPGDFRKTTH